LSDLVEIDPMPAWPIDRQSKQMNLF
jgi:hypothetical protein